MIPWRRAATYICALRHTPHASECMPGGTHSARPVSGLISLTSPHSVCQFGCVLSIHAENEAYLRVGRGAGPQPWEGLGRAGRWLRCGWARCAGITGATRPWRWQEGSGALPWPRAAAVSTRLRHSSFESSLNLSLARISSSACRVRVRGLGSGSGLGLGLGLGLG